MRYRSPSFPNSVSRVDAITPRNRRPARAKGVERCSDLPSPAVLAAVAGVDAPPPSRSKDGANNRETPRSHSVFFTLVFFLLSLVSGFEVTSASPLVYCHRLDAYPRRLYATKTSYDDVRSLQQNDDVTEVTWDKEDAQNGGASSSNLHGCGECRLLLEPRHNESLVNGLFRYRSFSSLDTDDDECQPISVYMLARHGTRYNKFSNMDRMSNELQRIRDLIDAHVTKGTMCREDLEWLRNWRPRHSVEDDSKLSTSGWSEVLGIGRRYGDMLPEILRRPYDQSLYEFRYTNYSGKGDRTRQSARAFAEGLWGEFGNVHMIENSRPDWLLQFYEHCHKYLRVVGGHPVEDYEKFKTGPEMTDVIRDVNRRLGLPTNTLGFFEIYLIFENCRLEHGLYRDSPWCSVLTPAMLEVIEYHQDVKYYWEDGYGHSISYEPACTLIDDILRHLEDDSKLGRFRFGHSGTLDSLYTRIGLYEDDEPLRATNYGRHRSRRRWATSRSTPMAANIAFIKYRCLHPPTLRVKTVVNEDTRRPVTIPGCPSALCPLETLRAIWRPIAEDCDIDRICEQHQTNAAAATVVLHEVQRTDQATASSATATATSAAVTLNGQQNDQTASRTATTTMTLLPTDQTATTTLNGQQDDQATATTLNGVENDQATATTAAAVTLNGQQTDQTTATTTVNGQQNDQTTATTATTLTLNGQETDQASNKLLQQR